MRDIEIKIRLEAMIAEREGMVAENKQREHLGHSMAYGEDSFKILADRMIMLCYEKNEADNGR